MLTTLLLTLLLGVNLTLLFIFFLLRTLKVKCPQCKQLKPLREIILFHLKTRTITGQPCRKCQQIKPKIEIF